MSVILPAKSQLSKLPEAEKTYITVSDNQKRMRITASALYNFSDILLIIQVFEGNSDKTAQNKQLGEFIVPDLPEKPAGEVEVDVTFSIDVRGVLTVKAKERNAESVKRAQFKNYQHDYPTLRG